MLYMLYMLYSLYMLYNSIDFDSSHVQCVILPSEQSLRLNVGAYMM
jgi:hypothetical protein